MHRIDTDGATEDNKWTEGDPRESIPATRIGEDWMNDLQENICKAIEDAGIVLQKADYTQLKTAINNLATVKANAAQAAAISAAASDATTKANNAQAAAISAAASDATTKANNAQAAAISAAASDATSKANAAQAAAATDATNKAGAAQSNAISLSRQQIMQGHKHIEGSGPISDLYNNIISAFGENPAFPTTMLGTFSYDTGGGSYIKTNITRVVDSGSSLVIYGLREDNVVSNKILADNDGTAAKWSLVVFIW